MFRRVAGSSRSVVMRQMASSRVGAERESEPLLLVPQISEMSGRRSIRQSVPVSNNKS